MSQKTKSGVAGAEIAVVYNDQCPICSWEIGHYKTYAEKVGAPAQFLPIAEGAPLIGVAPEAAIRRLHVRAGETVLSGVPAFIALWRALPRYAWLARMIDRPLLRPAGGFVYDRVLAPALFAMHRRREARARGAVG